MGAVVDIINIVYCNSLKSLLIDPLWKSKKIKSFRFPWATKAQRCLNKITFIQDGKEITFDDGLGVGNTMDCNRHFKPVSRHKNCLLKYFCLIQYCTTPNCIGLAYSPCLLITANRQELKKNVNSERDSLSITALLVA